MCSGIFTVKPVGEESATAAGAEDTARKRIAAAQYALLYMSALYTPGNVMYVKRRILTALLPALAMAQQYPAHWWAAVPEAGILLNAIEVESTPSVHLLLRTSGTPVYTSYSPSPARFIVDLTSTAKSPAKKPSTDGDAQ